MKQHTWASDTPVSRPDKTRMEVSSVSPSGQDRAPAGQGSPPSPSRPAPVHYLDPAEAVQAIDQAAGKQKNHHGRERRAQLRKDKTGEPCACSDTTPCLAHHGITGRRRFLRPD
jgi:hypothetical protein